MNNNRIATKTKDMDIKRGKHYWEVYNQRKDSKNYSKTKKGRNPQTWTRQIESYWFHNRLLNIV